jgi:hypothetical protein
MIGDHILKPEPTEPPVGQVEINLLTEPPFRADRVAIADQQHPDHQFRINRGATRMAVKGRKLGAQPAQIKDRVETTQQVIARHTVFEIELIKKTVLLSNLLAQHQRSPVLS